VYPTPEPQTSLPFLFTFPHDQDVLYGFFYLSGRTGVLVESFLLVFIGAGVLLAVQNFSLPATNTFLQRIYFPPPQQSGPRLNGTGKSTHLGHRARISIPSFFCKRRVTVCFIFWPHGTTRSFSSLSHPFLRSIYFGLPCSVFAFDIFV